MKVAFSATNNSKSPIVNKGLTALAQQVGFAEAGWAEGNSLEALEGYRQWIAENRHGPLDYLARNSALREDPKELLEGRGIGFVVVLLPLPWREGRSDQMPRGKGWIARYAQGRDYHKVMRKQLTKLLNALRREFGDEIQGRALVDSAPVLERDLAVQAGLGWIGKNGLLISKNWGSHMLIGSLLINQTLPLNLTSTLHKNYCGSCRSCLEQCPTQCLDEHKGLDARECISTWSIEDSSLPDTDRLKKWGAHLFGCDLCQDACPWNRFALKEASGHLLEFENWKHQIDVMEFLEILLKKPEKILFGSAMRRAERVNLLRNALVICLDQDLPLSYNLIEDFRNLGEEYARILDWYQELKQQLEGQP